MPFRTKLLRAREAPRYATWAATPAGRANRRRVAGLRDRFRGRRCVVMGNGPSLLECDLARLAGEVTIVSNAHFLIWDQLDYVPTFLTVEDVLVAEDRAVELEALSGITRVFPHDLAGVLGDAGDDKLYLNFTRFYEPMPQFSSELDRIAYWGGTVSFLNLQLAAFLGCDPIVLIGFDHSYVVPDGTTTHVIESEQEDVNHIHPDYFGPGYRWHDPNVERMERSYRLAREVLEQRGVQVLNATVGGQLEVFERRDYEELFAA